jgi:hypothetical protein
MAKFKVPATIITLLVVSYLVLVSITLLAQVAGKCGKTHYVPPIIGGSIEVDLGPCTAPTLIPSPTATATIVPTRRATATIVRTPSFKTPIPSLCSLDKAARPLNLIPDPLLERYDGYTISKNPKGGISVIKTTFPMETYTFALPMFIQKWIKLEGVPFMVCVELGGIVYYKYTG